MFAWNARANAQSAGWSSAPLVALGIGAAMFFVMATGSFKSFSTYEQRRSGPIVHIDATAEDILRAAQTYLNAKQN